MPLPSEYQTRVKFAHYYLDLTKQLSGEGAGAKVVKTSEWETFISHQVAEGVLPPAAKAWKCPRSLMAVLQNPPPTERVYEALATAGKPRDAYALAKQVDMTPMDTGRLLAALYRAGRLVACDDPGSLACPYRLNNGAPLKTTESVSA